MVLKKPSFVKSLRNSCGILEDNAANNEDDGGSAWEVSEGSLRLLKILPWSFVLYSELITTKMEPLVCWDCRY